ncbi:MAG: alpha-2-macroglobulin, partial [Planctomycetaceae bacterium]
MKNWGRFESGKAQPAGAGATLEYRYRNGSQVKFEAREIKVSELLRGVKEYLKGSPREVDWNRINIQDIGYRIVEQNEQALVGKTVATWNLELKPRPGHVDERVTVATPLQKAGAYLVTAQMEGGNLSRIIVWVADTVIAKKQLDGRSWYYIADAVSGLPIEKATVEYFGWNQTQVGRNRPEYRVNIQNKAYYSDANGQIILDQKALPQDLQWLVIATTPQGRLAYLGFTNVWYGNYYDPEYTAKKALLITDRPVYRPEQTVKFKFWVQQTKYDEPAVSAFAGKKFRVELNDPKGQKVLEETYTADEFGGLAGEYALPVGATLGVYGVQIRLPGPKQNEYLGGGNFRVEEYKKPEFEVTVDAPREPVKLGDKVTATITAKYYFGSPVTRAKVKYKVLRTPAETHWHPPAPWDWFYGRGYWWFSPDYLWYPGWNSWGCSRPYPIWWPHNATPPEVVADAEAEIGPEGTLAVEIDTLPAKELHGNQNHQYAITAEVVDESRRTIVGSGNVLVARKPFQVFVWLGRGYYKTGDTVEAFLHAHTLDQKPVRGKGELTLYKITYDAQQTPVENAVRTWSIDTDEQGDARQQLAASEAGQFRLSYKLTDAAGNIQEGATVFVVRGQRFDGREFRFNDLELITDKREYTPGEKVNLLVNTNRAGGAVLLFLRPTNGVYLPPKLIRLQGKSTVEEVAVVQKDMPNFFVEAITIANGKMHTELREVIVP